MTATQRIHIEAVQLIGFWYGLEPMRPTFRRLGTLGAVVLASVAPASWASSALAHEALYVANASGPSIYQYAVQEDGSLLQAASVAQTAERPDRMVLAPDDKSLYVAQGNTMGVGSLLQYTIQPDGTLTPKEPAGVPTEREIEGVAISPDGSRLYVIEGGFFGDGEVATYAIAPDGHSLYVSDEHFIVEPPEVNGGSVSQFTIGTDGSLAPKTPAAVPAGVYPKGIAISPSGTNLYVADSTESGHLSQYSIAPDGTLVPLSPPAVSAGRQPFGLAAGLDGRHLYVSNSAEYTIGEYEIEGGGTLKAMSPPTVRAGEWPMSIVLAETDGEPPIANEEPEEIELPIEEAEPPEEFCRETCCISAQETAECVGGGDPVIESESASNITEQEATVEAEVKPEFGTELTYFVEYGTTTSYGMSAPTPPTTIRWVTCGLICEGEDENPRHVSVSLTGLAAGATYHYRLIATNALGTAAGKDATFTTTTCEGVVEPLTPALCGEEKPPANSGEPPGASGTPPGLENSPFAALVKALKACNQEPSRKRAACKKLARAKYGPKPGTATRCGESPTSMWHARRDRQAARDRSRARQARSPRAHNARHTPRLSQRPCRRARPARHSAR